MGLLHEPAYRAASDSRLHIGFDLRVDDLEHALEGREVRVARTIDKPAGPKALRDRFNAGKHQTPTNFSRAEPIMYEPPMYRAKITVQQPIKEIKTLRASTNAKMDGNAVSLVIESVHEAVRIFV